MSLSFNSIKRERTTPITNQQVNAMVARSIGCAFRDTMIAQMNDLTITDHHAKASFINTTLEAAGVSGQALTTATYQILNGQETQNNGT